MFTEIVEESGRVESVTPARDAIQTGRPLPPLRARLEKPATGLAVNGCCLTVVKIGGRAGGRRLPIRPPAETWRRTNLQFVHPGSAVNLERSLRADGNIGGHFVTGHIDGVGKNHPLEGPAATHVLDIRAAPAIMRYVIVKGSIAVDGISLTVAAMRARSFRVWIIPHTLAVTALRERRTGDAVNLEADLLGQICRALSYRGPVSVDFWCG